MPSATRQRSLGFSLIELMVAVAIAGIIAAIAYPTYTSHVQRGRRADAISAITTVMQSQERYRSNRTAYASALADLGLESAMAGIAPYYTITLAPGTPLNGGTPSYDIGYAVTATATGKQLSDVTCKSLTVNMTGAIPVYTATGDPGNTGTNSQTGSQCWPK